MAESTKRLISIGSASQQLGVSVFTVRRLIKAGQLQAVESFSARTGFPERN